MPVVHDKTDIVSIGAGWTASIMAWKLCEAGMNMVSIEQGPMRYADPDFSHNHDGMSHRIRKRLMTDLRSETWTWRPNPNLPSLPIRQFGAFHPGEGLGGSAIHWTAETWRFLPSDFKYRTHHIERYGEDKLPEGSTIQDWPITYEELEPYYTAFDYDIGVGGQTGNLNGEIIPGGNPFEGPRSKPYPLPPLERSIPATMFAEACERLGYHSFPQPSGILSQGYTDPFGNTRSACIYCGYCTRFGCEVDAKSSPVTTHIPAAMKTGRWEVRPNSKVLYINVGADGLATGLTYVDADGVEHFQPADIVLVSGYTLTNVRMLLLSQSEQHPAGIGNDRGQVGRNYTYQLVTTPAEGVFEGRQFNLFMGNGVIQQVMYDYYGDNFDHSELDFIGGASIYAGGGQRDPLTSTTGISGFGDAGGGGPEPASGSEIEDEFDPTHPAVANEIGSLAGRGSMWGQAWKDMLRNYWNNTISVGIQGESLPYQDQFLDLDPRYTDAWGQPLLRITYDFHENDYNLYRYLAARCREILEEMGPTHTDFTEELEPHSIYSYGSTHNTGGAIMGSDPGNSVTNKFGQVWDTPNVFVTGAALYPQNPGANPTGTLAPLAYMAADAIRDEYRKNPGEIISH